MYPLYTLREAYRQVYTPRYTPQGGIWECYTLDTPLREAYDEVHP